MQYNISVAQLKHVTLKVKKKKKKLFLYFESHPCKGCYNKISQKLDPSSVSPELNFTKCKNYGNSTEQKLENNNLKILSISGIWQNL